MAILFALINYTDGFGQTSESLGSLNLKFMGYVGYVLHPQPSRKFHLLQLALNKVGLETNLQPWKIDKNPLRNLWVSISWCNCFFLFGADSMEVGTETTPNTSVKGTWMSQEVSKWLVNGL